ncbi:10779_t:CDS:2, partial [Gigaspora margarita]
MKINNFTLPRFPSFRGQSEESEHVLTSDNRPWMSTQYFKFKLITSEKMTMVMKTDRVINLPYVNSFNFADGFDIIHISVSDLVDKKTAVKKAISLHYIYTNHFDMYIEDTTHYRSTLDKLVNHWNIQVTYSLTGWEVTNVSGDLMNNNTTKVITQYYNWD